MNELGVLAAFIPEFDKIVAMMQFNMYHHYTVDEHTIQVHPRTWPRSSAASWAEDLPVSTEIIETGINRRVLYVALPVA